jgi:pyrroloquinoline quinone (PQQ) biosynthesis protein C
VAPLMVDPQHTAHNSTEQRIRALAERAAEHPALNNRFYELWMSQELSVDQVELIACNYYERVRHTPDRIALAFVRMDDIAARTETIENLHDEMGRGDPANAHSLLLRTLFEALLSRMRATPIKFDKLDAFILNSTKHLLEKGDELFSSRHPLEACGGLLAQEWHAYIQMVKLYEGMRNYIKFFELEEFHDACEYFYLHIGATEKRHRTDALHSAARMCRSAEDVAYLEQGFNHYLELLADNWDELYTRVISIAV